MTIPITTSDIFFRMVDRKNKNLYPDSAIPFLKELFLVVDETFFPQKQLKPQLRWKTKLQYETMLTYLLKNIIQKEGADLEESSLKLLLSKILEDYLLKNLDIFYNYNLYFDKERKKTKTIIDSSINYLYQLEETEPFILAKEIELRVEEKIYTDSKIIKMILAKNIKKSKMAIVTNNTIYKKYLQELTNNLISK